MNYKRILAIGDIHGEWEKFMSLYKKINFNPSKELLVFLGDYIDRGADSIKILEWIYKNRSIENMIFLRGNHEQMMLDYYYQRGERFKLWLWSDGNKTLEKLKTKSKKSVKKYLNLIESMPLYYRILLDGQEVVFCHAGLRPGITLEKQSQEDILWIREDFFEHYDENPLVVAGHTPLMTQEWTNVPTRIKGRNIIMIDTGSFLPNGCISCINILTGKYWQS